MQEIYFTKETTLFLYTDGLTEAMNKAHEQFGINRVEDLLRDCVDVSPEEMIQKMNKRVHLFMEDEEQSDDLTMLSIKYIPKLDEFDNEEEITLKNDVRNVKELNAFVKSITDKLDIDTSQARNIKLAVEEAVVNVMDYAYPMGTEGDIIVRVMYDEKKLKFVIIDAGIAFDPTEAAKADITLSVEDRPIGGLGLLLVREMMDSMNYERIGNKNHLTLITSYKKKSIQ
jgi:sigma-B regulation protein RsbU (phosphoserine phosphatase)